MERVRDPQSEPAGSELRHGGELLAVTGVDEYELPSREGAV